MDIRMRNQQPRRVLMFMALITLTIPSQLAQRSIIIRCPQSTWISTHSVQLAQRRNPQSLQLVQKYNQLIIHNHSSHKWTLLLSILATKLLPHLTQLTKPQLLILMLQPQQPPPLLLKTPQMSKRQLLTLQLSKRNRTPNGGEMKMTTHSSLISTLRTENDKRWIKVLS